MDDLPEDRDINQNELRVLLSVGQVFQAQKRCGQTGLPTDRWALELVSSTTCILWSIRTGERVSVWWDRLTPQFGEWVLVQHNGDVSNTVH